MKSGTIEIVKRPENEYLGATQFKLRGRFYTAFGRLFIVAGKHTEEEYQACCGMKQYMLTNMNINALNTGDTVVIYAE